MEISFSASQLKRSLRQLKADKLLKTQEDPLLQRALMANQFGCICLQANKLESATKHLQDSLQLFDQVIGEGKVTNTHMNLGNLASQTKDFQQAIHHYQIVVKNSPYADENSHDLRSILWSSRLNSYEAYCDAHTNLACLLANIGQAQKAYEHCLIAIRLNPLNSEAQTNFGDLLRQLGRNQEAITHTWAQIVNYSNSVPVEDEGQQVIYDSPSKINLHSESFQVKGEDPTFNCDGTISIVCVKWGTKYGPNYVNNILSGIQKHTTRKFSFHCFTDDPTGINSQVIVHALKTGWTGWWGKCTLFAEDGSNLNGRQFFIDLDMIITGNIDDILGYQGHFGILRTDEISCEMQNKNGYNSSVMAWSSKGIYDELQKNEQNIRRFIVRFDFWLEMMVQNADFLQDLYPNQIKDYLQECQQELPQDTRIVCFPRNPKPHDAKAQWIQEHWI